MDETGNHHLEWDQQNSEWKITVLTHLDPRITTATAITIMCEWIMGTFLGRGTVEEGGWKKGWWAK
jgi:hypothetical protein